MVLVDTSVWIDHLARQDDTLSRLLDDGLVLVHPMVIGELACGSLRDRDAILGLLQALERAPEASLSELLRFVDLHRLWGRGISLVDAHLLASARLAAASALYTRDRRLHRVADEFGLAV